MNHVIMNSNKQNVRLVGSKTIYNICMNNNGIHEMASGIDKAHKFIHHKITFSDCLPYRHSCILHLTPSIRKYSFVHN